MVDGDYQCVGTGPVGGGGVEYPTSRGFAWNELNPGTMQNLISSQCEKFVRPNGEGYIDYIPYITNIPENWDFDTCRVDFNRDHNLDQSDPILNPANPIMTASQKGTCNSGQNVLCFSTEEGQCLQDITDRTACETEQNSIWCGKN